MGVAAETGLTVGRIPLHGCPLAIAALFFRPAGDADRVFYRCDAGRRRGELADLLALIEQGCCFGREQQGRDELRDLEIMRAVAITVPTAHVVVIVEYEQGLGVV